MGKVHQNIVIAGVDRGDSPDRVGSKFTNEGKWHNFIQPLLPYYSYTLVEYGSNAGLFLRLARRHGFERIVGLERSESDCKMARLYRDGYGMNYEIRNELVNEEFDFDSLPIADVSLLANYHYHQNVSEFMYLLDKLETKTRHCLVVSVNGVAKVPWRASPDYEDVLSMFRNWEYVGGVTDLEAPNDPYPRDMFSMLFKSRKLVLMPVKDIKHRHDDHNRTREAMEDFVRRVLADPNLDIRETKHYQMQQNARKHKWSPQRIDDFMEDKRQLIRDIDSEGLQVAIVLNEDNVIIDGLHRFLAIKGLGHKEIPVRIA